MDKRVTLKLNEGSLQTGFSVSVQIGDEGAIPTTEILGRLPAAPDLNGLYQQWQMAYRQLGSSPLRLEVSRVGFATNVSYLDDCYNLAEKLQYRFNRWLQSKAFRPVQDKLLEQLNPDDSIRLLVQTQEIMVQRLPWHLWELCDRYPNLEIALSAPIYEQKAPAGRTRSKVRILAVLGHSQGLDIDTDITLLNHLPNADIHCLTEPNRQTLDQYLWDTEGWDILFFAGHSSTQMAFDPRIANAKIEQQKLLGKLAINSTDTITIPQLKNALRTSLSRGLQIAIFNSCDGLGLAHALADLQIPQILVMQEAVPDQVAHTFLKSFLDAFAQGRSFYLAVREAREKLQGLEDKFPCAAWLPTIYQNPADIPPRWHTLTEPSLAHTAIAAPDIAIPELQPPLPQPKTARPPRRLFPWRHLLATGAILGLRQLGWLQSLEMQGFDRLMALRTPERPDPRLVIVTITDEDIQAQDADERRGSLSDQALLGLLQRLAPMEPRTIGLDIYRDFPVRSHYPQLAQQLTNNNFFAVCKSRDSDAGNSGIAPPPEVPDDRIGFSDFVADGDTILRRQLLAMTPEPSSPCASPTSLGMLLALHYLNAEGATIGTSPTGDLQVNDVTFTPIRGNAGGYQNIDVGGHQLLLNYRQVASPEKIADTVTLTEVLAGQVNPAAIRDRIVLIGTTDISYGDLWHTPFHSVDSSKPATSGVFMQAHMTSHLLSAVLDGRPQLTTWPQGQETLWIILWGSIGSVAIMQFKNRHNNELVHRVIILSVTEFTLLAACWFALNKFGYWLPWVPPALLLLTIVGILPIFKRLQPSPISAKEAS